MPREALRNGGMGGREVHGQVQYLLGHIGVVYLLPRVPSTRHEWRSFVLLP